MRLERREGGIKKRNLICQAPSTRTALFPQAEHLLHPGVPAAIPSLRAVDAALPGTGRLSHTPAGRRPLGLSSAVLILPLPGAQPQPRALTDHVCLPLPSSDPDPRVWSRLHRNNRTTPASAELQPPHARGKGCVCLGVMI